MIKQKRILVIGSLSADVIVQIPHLPTSQEDLHIQSQTFALGGCAGNVAMILRALHQPFDLFAPIGQGVYGDFVARELEKQQITSMIPRVDEENGCCYCMVEESGERTFLSYHGTEYRFRKDWFERIDKERYDAVYVCGLELEETTGECSNLVNLFRKCYVPFLMNNKDFSLIALLHCKTSTVSRAG